MLHVIIIDVLFLPGILGLILVLFIAMKIIYTLFDHDSTVNALIHFEHILLG